MRGLHERKNYEETDIIPARETEALDATYQFYAELLDAIINQKQKRLTQLLEDYKYYQKSGGRTLDINHDYGNGKTALWYAALTRNRGLASLLIEAGADASIKDKQTGKNIQELISIRIHHGREYFFKLLSMEDPYPVLGKRKQTRSESKLPSPKKRKLKYQSTSEDDYLLNQFGLGKEGDQIDAIIAQAESPIEKHVKRVKQQRLPGEIPETPYLPRQPQH